MRDAPLDDSSNFFKGILSYIHFNSEGRYNVSELLLEFRAVQPGSDPAFLLDAASDAAYESGDGPGQCLVFTFHRIRIRPTAYAIRTGQVNRTTRNLMSYVFQGLGPRGWETIDERQNLVVLPGFSVRLAHVDTGKEFARFRLVPTEQPLQGTHFAISGFEIHGAVRVVESVNGAKITVEAEDEGFNPWAFRDAE
jgi:hypothetical protein